MLIYNQIVLIGKAMLQLALIIMTIAPIISCKHLEHSKIQDTTRDSVIFPIKQELTLAQLDKIIGFSKTSDSRLILSLYEENKANIKIEPSNIQNWGIAYFLRFLGDSVKFRDDPRYKFSVERDDEIFKHREAIKISDFIKKHEETFFETIRNIDWDFYEQKISHPLNVHFFDLAAMTELMWEALEDKSNYPYLGDKKNKGGIDFTFPIAKENSIQKIGGPVTFVTHAQTQFCKRPKFFKASIENEIASLKKSNKIIYLGTEKSGWFLDGKYHEKLNSSSGQHNFQVLDSYPITLLGGYWGLCMKRTVGSIASTYFIKGRKKLVLNLPTKGIAVDGKESLFDVWIKFRKNKKLLGFYTLYRFLKLPFSYDEGMGSPNHFALNADVFVDDELLFKYRTKGEKMLELRLSTK